MSQRLSLDRDPSSSSSPLCSSEYKSRECAVAQGDRIGPQSLPDLVQLRQEVKSGSLDLKSVINRLVKLTQGVVGATGAGV
jgi:hypothetical protein